MSPDHTELRQDEFPQRHRNALSHYAGAILIGLLGVGTLRYLTFGAKKPGQVTARADTYQF